MTCLPCLHSKERWRFGNLVLPRRVGFEFHSSLGLVGFDFWVCRNGRLGFEILSLGALVARREGREGGGGSGKGRTERKGMEGKGSEGGGVLISLDIIGFEILSLGALVAG